jgi:hypothetical protein
MSLSDTSSAYPCLAACVIFRDSDVYRYRGGARRVHSHARLDAYRRHVLRHACVWCVSRYFDDFHTPPIQLHLVVASILLTQRRTRLRRAMNDRDAVRRYTFT